MIQTAAMQEFNKMYRDVTGGEVISGLKGSVFLREEGLKNTNLCILF